MATTTSTPRASSRRQRLAIALWTVALLAACWVLIGETYTWEWQHTAATLTAAIATWRILRLADQLEAKAYETGQVAPLQIEGGGAR